MPGSEGCSESRSYRRLLWLTEPRWVTEAPSPSGLLFASVDDGNVVLRTAADDCRDPLTTDGSADFAWDIEAPRNKLIAGMALRRHVLDPWSADGGKLFAIKMDRRAVPNLPFIHYLQREDELRSLKIQRAGGPIDIAHPHVIHVSSKRAQRLALGDTSDHYFTLIAWLPDGSEVLFSRHSRDFKQVDVLAGNPDDGTVRTVLSEHSETFVAIQHDVLFGGDNHITILADGAGLIWRSARSGWNHFYLYSTNGMLVRALTRGEFPVMAVERVDLRGGWLYFTAHHDRRRPYDKHLCRVKIAGGEIERLTPLDGQNDIVPAASLETFTVRNSRPDRAFRTDLLTCDGTHLKSVEDAEVATLADDGSVTVEEFRVMAADGETELWGVMYKPRDLDPARKYPLIDHLYAGPQVAMVNHRFGFADNGYKNLDRLLAQSGYVVISVDARGTPERSKAFHDLVYGNWSRHEIPDHAAAIAQLAHRYPFIDLSRVGVWGHSWGGYFTIRALAQAPGTFRVGVAAAPATDPYDSILYEPYLDLPGRAKTAYDYAKLSLQAGRIKGRLMLIVGTADPKNHSDVMEMTHTLIDAGIDHELVVLPNAPHTFQGKDNDYFVSKLLGHFQRYLQP